MKPTYFTLYILMFICFCPRLYSQTVSSSDSIIAQGIIKKYNIKHDMSVFVNNNGSQLNIGKKEAKKISQTLLFYKFGRVRTIRQMPFKIIPFSNYWIILGHQYNKKRRGGTFTIIIDKRNACIKYISHGK